MTGQVADRIIWHVKIPVCETLRGVKEHLKAIGMRDGNWLAYYLKCDLDELHRRIWQLVKQRKGVKVSL